MFHDPSNNSLPPKILTTFDISVVVYRLENLTVFKIINNDKFLYGLEIKTLKKASMTGILFLTRCLQSEFLGKVHNHIITGNLKIKTRQTFH